MSEAYASTLPRCLRAADRRNFTFTFLCFTERCYRPGRSRSGSVSLVTRLRAGWSLVRIRLVTKFFCSPKRPGTALGTTQLTVQWVARLFPWYSDRAVKLTHSPPSVTGVRHELSSPLIPTYAFMAWTRTLPLLYGLLGLLLKLSDGR